MLDLKSILMVFISHVMIASIQFNWLLDQFEKYQTFVEIDFFDSVF